MGILHLIVVIVVLMGLGIVSEAWRVGILLLAMVNLITIMSVRSNKNHTSER